MKRILAFVCLISLAFGCTGCVNREANKRRIFDLVIENKDLLLADIEEKDFTRSESIEGVEHISVSNRKHLIEYDCGGYGFGSATSYRGFYYSSDDDMTKLWCAGEPLEPDGKGFMYKEPDGDNQYYTEHIIDHFYYYDASY